MRHRQAISHDGWEPIQDRLPGEPDGPGVTAGDSRLFIDAVLWIAKTGAPWRDLPERFGNWAVNGLGLPVQFVLTPGQAADVTQACTLPMNMRSGYQLEQAATEGS